MWKPEVIAGARAMYRAFHGEEIADLAGGWEGDSQARRDHYCRSFVAGLEALLPVMPLEEWHEDDGHCLWFRFPIDEPPYVGSPLDTEWPDYHTHWMPLHGIADLVMSSPAALRHLTTQDASDAKGEES